MATTTNYSWSTPDDTALVKDGAAAIRSLGTSIDTTTKALNPSTTLGDIEYRSSSANTNTRLPIGTTGQVLAVVGGVPAWATTADQTPLTTKGDIFTFTTEDARLGVGANGTVLTADSAEASGLKWATPAAGGMTLLSTTTCSGTTDITSIDQTYTNLFIEISGVTNATGGTYFRCQFNATAGNHSFTATERKTTTVGWGYDDSDIYLSDIYYAKYNDTNNAWNMVINNYANTSHYKTFDFVGGYLNNGDDLKVTLNGAGIWRNNAAITSLRFAGVAYALNGGTIKIYGVK
jgi:hypothetical protein